MPKVKRSEGVEPPDRSDTPLSTEERSSPGSGEDLEEDAADLQPEEVEGDEPAR